MKRKVSAKLSVNINKIATLRNARGGDTPNVLLAAKKAIEFGAQGITVHPRPDERHITIKDVQGLAKLLKGYKDIEFNIEGYPSSDYLLLVKKHKPHQCTLVPDPPHVITSNAGWDFAKNRQFLIRTVKKIHTSGMRVSLFLDPSTMTPQQWMALAEIGPDRVELYTEAYAKAHDRSGNKWTRVLALYQEAARKASLLGLGVNAGHDLTSTNLGFLIKHIPEIEEVSIGHALISDAIYWGLEKTIKTYRQAIKSAQ
jgi:pyridoxine 5-phosphate synthase